MIASTYLSTVVVGCACQGHHSFCVNAKQSRTDSPIGTQVLQKVSFVHDYSSESRSLFLKSLLLDKATEKSSNTRSFSFASFLEKILGLSFLSPAMNDE